MKRVVTRVENGRLFKALALILLCGMSGAFDASAQTTPDAGQILQDLKKKPIPPLPDRVPKISKPKPDAPKPDAPEVTLTVQEFLIEGNTLLSNEKLAPALSFYLNRPLSFADLKEATNAIVNAYQENHFIARAFLPKQDVTEGIVTIAVVEAVFGGAVIEGNLPKHIEASRIIEVFREQLT